MCKLSVIVPVFNSQKTLERCLNSIINQSFRDIEILCVNDGSTDTSRNIIIEMMEKDKRIKLIEKVNGGLSSARNAGLNMASGMYVGFIDSDDFVESGMYEKMISIIEEDAVDLVGCGTMVHYEAWLSLKESDDIYYNVSLGRRAAVNNDIFKTIDVSAWNKIFKKSIIDKFEIRFPEGLWYEDASFLWKYLSSCSYVSFIPDKFYNYIRYPSSIMGITFAKKTIKVLDHIKISNEVLYFLVKNGKINFYSEAFADFLISNFWFSFRYLPLHKKHLSFIELSKTLKIVEALSVSLPTDTQNRKLLVMVNKNDYLQFAIGSSFRIIRRKVSRVIEKLKRVYNV